MVDPKRAAELIRQHFEEATTEKFIENLRKHCPEVFSDQEQDNQPKLSETKILYKQLNNESALAKDWSTPEEDAAWQDL